MKKLILFILIMSATITSFGQNLRFELGVTTSKLDWDANGNKLYGESITSPSFLFGLDYLNNKLFNFSSQI